jgi:hypothetical protein
MVADLSLISLRDEPGREQVVEFISLNFNEPFFTSISNWSHTLLLPKIRERMNRMMKIKNRILAI